MIANKLFSAAWNYLVKKIMSMQNTCSCGYTGFNFSPSQFRSGGKCRPCRRKDAKVWNSEMHNRRSALEAMKYPTPHLKCVYAFTKGSEIVYIGSSTKTPHRIYNHYNDVADKGKSFCHEIPPLMRQLNYNWVILWYGDNDEYLKSQEKALIQIHQPKFNKIKYKNYEG